MSSTSFDRHAFAWIAEYMASLWVIPACCISTTSWLCEVAEMCSLSLVLQCAQLGICV